MESIKVKFSLASDTMIVTQGVLGNYNILAFSGVF